MCFNLSVTKGVDRVMVTHERVFGQSRARACNAGHYV